MTSSVLCWPLLELRRLCSRLFVGSGHGVQCEGTCGEPCLVHFRGRPSSSQRGRIAHTVPRRLV